MNNIENVYLPFVVGTCIDLVQYTQDDAAMIQQWLNDPEVTNYLTRGSLPIRIEDEKAFLENLYTSLKDVMFGIYVKADQKPIGCVGLHNVSERDRVATFGIVIGDKEYWGKGHGLETTNLLLHYAFNVRNMRKVLLDVIADNTRAINCYIAAGFTEVCRHKAHIFKEGMYKDMLTMDIFADSWRAMHNT